MNLPSVELLTTPTNQSTSRIANRVQSIGPTSPKISCDCAARVKKASSELGVAEDRELRVRAAQKDRVMSYRMIA